MPTTLSPLRYPGGKTAYAPMLRNIISANQMRECQYVEPFAGGGGAAISLLLAGDVARIWLNDLDYSVYAFWKAMLNYTGDFIRMIKSKRISMAEWKRQRAIHRSDESDPLIRGFAAFFMNRCNRAGILAANPVGGLAQAGIHRLGARFRKDALIGKIRRIAERKDLITISNLDAAALLRRHIPKADKTFLYLDPPYFHKGGLLYLNHYTADDHLRLSKAIQACRHPWVLSYDDRPEIINLYRGLPIYRRTLRYSIAAPSIGSELIISNLRMPDELIGVE